MKLYTYHRSSACHRVRIAMNLKGLSYDAEYVSLKDGEQHSVEYLAMNPQGVLPCVVDGDAVLTQSLAIIGYLEDKYPERSLMPEAAVDRALVRALAQIVTTDVHPLTTKRVFEFMRDDMAVDYEQRSAWYTKWHQDAFATIERMLSVSPKTGIFCHGDKPGLADVCLVPQVQMALDSGFDMTDYPVIRRIYQHAMTLPEFQAAAPSTQVDSVAESLG